MVVLRRAALVVGLLSLVCAWQPSVLSASPPATRESSYTVYSRGLRVGDLKTVCSIIPYHEKKALKFEARTRAVG